jgi:hypothetical protein
MSAGGASSLGFSSSLVEISTSIEPTLCGPVYAGKAGVGLMFLSHVMFASAAGDRPLRGSEDEAERSDWKTRVSDSLIVLLRLELSMYVRAESTECTEGTGGVQWWKARKYEQEIDQKNKREKRRGA